MGTNNVLTLPAMAKCIVGCGFYVSNAGQTYITFRSDNGATSHITVRQVDQGPIEIRLGSQTGTLLASTDASFACPTAAWRHLQISCTIADTGGRVIVKYEGNTILDYTGDTRNGGTSTLIDTLFFGASSTATAYRFDDVWVCDGVDATATQGRANNDFLGDLRVAASVPMAAGDTTQLTPSTGANWAAVDEIPPNTTDYVSGSAAGLRDLYNVQDLPTGVVTVYAVQPLAYAAKSDAGTANLKTVMKESNGVVTVGASTPLQLAWGPVSDALKTTKGGTTTPLTVADVNALQVGVETG